MSQTTEQRSSDYPVDSGFDPLDPDFLEDPCPYFARFRREAPVFFAPGHPLELPYLRPEDNDSRHFGE
jgi:hypothetical protein